MALDLEQVKQKFSRYSGEDITDAGARGSLCAQLCEECAARAEALLERSGTEADEAGTAALESWAAAEAFYQLTLADEATAPASVSADGVQIVSGERSRKAKSLAEIKWGELSPVLGEGAFYFGRV